MLELKQIRHLLFIHVVHTDESASIQKPNTPAQTAMTASKYAALLAPFLLTACSMFSSGVSRGIANSEYIYTANDVSINHFGVNYSINQPLKVNDERVTAQTLASDCESGTGTLKILTGKPEDDVDYPVTLNGNKPQDKIFKHLCDKNPKLVRVVRGCS